MIKKPTTRLGAKPLNLRLDEDMVEKIRRVHDHYITTMNPPGFSMGPVKDLPRAAIVRWALEEGLAVIEGKLSKKARRS